MVLVFGFLLGFSAAFGGLLRRSVTIMGFISFVAGLMLLMFTWMGAGSLVSTRFYPESDAAMAFDVITGLLVMVFLVGSVKKHRFYDIEYPPTETGAAYISPRYLAIASLVIVFCAIVGASTSISGSVVEKGAGHTTIVGLSVMMILTSLEIAACCVVGAHFQKRPEVLGCVSFISALFLILYTFMLTGHLQVFKPNGARDAALAFNVITGLLTMIFLFGSVKEHRFTDDEVVATRYILEEDVGAQQHHHQQQPAQTYQTGEAAMMIPPTATEI